ncbi:Radical SAM protein [Sulfidibacter corallicola]|uniref:Radical SAM protein n=1 Tax=Sulfidibacter corallicola TaxID=2818388 RepID=A0A8A4TEX5_SULCO|nr:radical SAM protein [Sulfidibacter corallicola]QTD48506.1 radical SAM protein [Sulfidibacter corallicola]
MTASSGSKPTTAALSVAGEAPRSGLVQTHVISWNLTRRCNLQCEHCYIEGAPLKKSLLKGELSTEACFAVVDQICEINPNALVIMTGGEPLLRPDVFEIADYASRKGLWCVMGTNGVLISERLVVRMKEAGIKGVGLSLDALDEEVHDRFRRVRGAWRNTVEGSRILAEHDMPFIVQTTVGTHNRSEVADIAAFAHRLGARVFNLYFLVPTGRGTWVTDIGQDEYEAVLQELMDIQKSFDGKMLINAKCAPHYQRLLYEKDPESPFLKAFSAGAGGCPAGTHYCGIRPDGNVTPCPYLPSYAGNLRETTFKQIWEESDLFRTIRARNQMADRCGACEFSRVCGGCRARAFAESGNVMGQDPLCEYQPGRHGTEPIQFRSGSAYGEDAVREVRWHPAARARLDRIPSFVRGMVVKRVEAYAADRGLDEIDEALMDEIRARMPVRFGKGPR